MSEVARPDSAPPAAAQRGVEGTVPLRPLTTGELLDGAVALLRTRPGRLVLLGLLLATAEQALLYPLRAAADQDITLRPATEGLRAFGLLLAVGFVTETLAISTLAAIAARGSGQALLGSSAPPRRPVPWGPVAGAILLVAAVVALFSAPVVAWIDDLGIFAFVFSWVIAFQLWALPYGLLGLGAAAAVVERRSAFSAVGRALRLASRDSLRAVFVRGVGYASWALVRGALLIATTTLITTILGALPSSTWDRVVIAVSALVINAIAYPALGCLDVMVLLETRMRTEGLDIALRWAMRRGVAPTLDAPR